MFRLVGNKKVKLSTRKGNVILLEPTIAEAVSRAKDQIGKITGLENKNQVVRCWSWGYQVLWSYADRTKMDMSFDEAMVSFIWTLRSTTYARIQSILRKEADFNQVH